MTTEPTALDLLASLTARLNQGAVFDEVATGLQEELAPFVPCNRLSVAFLKPGTTTLVVGRVRSDGDVRLGTRFREDVGGTPLGEALERGEPLVVPDLEAALAAHPDSASTALLVREGLRSAIVVPLVAGGRLTGAMTFASRARDAYSAAHGELLKAVSGQLASIIERERLVSRLRADNRRLRRAHSLKQRFAEELRGEVERRTAELRRAQDELRALLEITRSIHATLDPAKVFATFVENLRGLVAFSRAGLLMLDESGSTLRFRALEPAGAKPLGFESRVPVEGSAAGLAVRERRSIAVPDVQRERRFWEDSFLAASGNLAHVNVPLFARDRAIGALAVACSDRDALSADAIALLERLADPLSAAVANATTHAEVSQTRERLEEENLRLREAVGTERGPVAIGDSPEWRRLMRQVDAVAPTDATVLVQGETGTGKELVARTLHRHSRRSAGPFVAVNCGSLTDELVASELFGHEKGAFTGAHERRLGRLEIAGGGTLFLDEVGELGAAVQVKLLRVLQEREFERVGGAKTLRADVRVIAATNRDLSAEVEAGRFRQDLYYRLNVFPLRVPPLRERAEDIEPLVLAFVHKHAQRMGRRFDAVDAESLERCRSYAWPGNVRELENVVERSVVLSSGGEFRIAPEAFPATAGGGDRTFDDAVRTVLEDALRRSRGKIYGPSGAAARLGLKPSTLQAKLVKHGLDRASFARDPSA